MEAVMEIEAGPQEGFPSSALLGRSRAVLRRTARDLKDSLAVVAELEACAYRCYVGAEEPIDEEIADSVVGLLRAARDDNPHQELEIVIFGAPTEARGGGSNGSQGQAGSSVRPD